MLELAVDSFLVWVDHENPYLRRYVARSLGLIGSGRAVEPLIARLDHADADVRCAMVGALSSKLEEIDKKLLSGDLDGIFPFLDPREEISSEFVGEAAEELSLTVENVKERYESLAERFHLRLHGADRLKRSPSPF